MKKIIGATFQLIAFSAALVLLLTPFGLSPLTSGPIMWFAFPCGYVAGHLLLISGGSTAEVRLVSAVTGGSLLMLALAATVAQFLVSGGVLSTVADSFSLWYLASGGYVLGGMAWQLRAFGQGKLPPS